MKTIFFCVSSDVVTDQRVLRHCNTLTNLGYSVTVVARKTSASLDVPPLAFRVKRFTMLFESGPLFYLFFNLRLFFYLLFQPKAMLWANDLDTLVPCVAMKNIKRQTLVFDAHELFTEVPELVGKPLKKHIWTKVESIFVPKADHHITVNQSLADKFRERYNLHFQVIRNTPPRFTPTLALSKRDHEISEDALICILQGSGLNEGRGLIETVQAVCLVEDVVLLVIGSGTALEEARSLSSSLNLGDRIRFIPRLPYHEMMAYTQIADVGLAFDTHPCLNFQLALPNKIFDYFQAGIAVLCGPQPEISKLVVHHACGKVMEKITPEIIAENLRYFQSNPTELATMKEKSYQASAKENWDIEETNLIDLTKKF